MIDGIMAILAINLVIGHVNHMGKFYRLIRFIKFLTSQLGSCFIDQLYLPGNCSNKEDPKDIPSFHFLKKEDVQDDPGEKYSQQYEKENLIDNGFALGKPLMFKIIQKKLDHLNIHFIEIEGFVHLGHGFASRIQYGPLKIF